MKMAHFGGRPEAAEEIKPVARRRQRLECEGQFAGVLDAVVKMAGVSTLAPTTRPSKRVGWKIGIAEFRNASGEGCKGRSAATGAA